MLENIPKAMSRMARNVVINHPNSFNCQAFRKTVTRTADQMVGGLPTLGGLGVLDAGDEEQYSYAWIGNGYAMPVEGFAPSQMMDRIDANNGSGNEVRFLIEPEEMSGDPGSFEPTKGDVIYLLLGSGPAPAKLAFEIVDIEAMVNIPPYATRYITNRRDDLHIPAG